MKERDEIEQLFSDTFSNEKVVVPASVKTGIDKRIGTKGIAGWKIIGLGLLFGAVVFGTWKLNQSNSSKKMTIAEGGKKETLATEKIHSSNSENPARSNFDNGKVNNQNVEQTTSLDVNLNQYSVEKNSPQNTSDKSTEFPSETEKTVIGQDSNTSKSNSGSQTRKNVTIGDSKNVDPIESSSKFDFLSGGEGSPTENSDSNLGRGMGVRELNHNAVGSDDNFSNDINLVSTQEGSLKNQKTNATSDYVEQNVSNDFNQGGLNEKMLLLNSNSKPTLEVKVPSLFEDHLVKELSSDDLEPVQPITLNNTKDRNISWELGLYSGIYNSYNKKSESNDLRNNWNSKIGFETSVQAKLRFKPRLAVGLGVGYGQNKLNISEETITTSIDSVPGSWIPDPLDTMGVDSIYVSSNQWDTTFTSSAIEGKYSVSKISIPLYFEYRQPLFNSFYLDLALGARFNIQSWKSENSPFSPTLSKFNMDIMLRPQFTYEIRKFSVGIYGRLDYIPFGLSNWNQLRANSVRGGLGINLSYRF